MSRRLLILLLIYAGIILIYAAIKPAELDWTESFSRHDKIPFGTYILHEELGQLFDVPVAESEVPFYNLDSAGWGRRAAYFSVNRHFYADKLDVEKLLDFVESGNVAMISAFNFPQILLDTLDLTLAEHYPYGWQSTDWRYPVAVDAKLRESPDSVWQLALSGAHYYFLLDTSARKAGAQVFGTIDAGENAFVVYPFGSGTLMLHSFPFAFTNFHMLKETDYFYASGVLSHIPRDYHVVWDEYYKGQPHTSSNPFVVLARHTSFRWAYWVLVAGTVIFIIFTARRKQRPIPVIRPPRNASLDFVRTLGDLYYQTGNHTDLARKKLRYFADQLRTTYRLDPGNFTVDDALDVARRTGKDRKQTTELFEVIRGISETSRVQPEQLKALQRHLDHFYERK